MKINQMIYDEIKKNNNMITTSQVLSLGYSKQILTNYVKEGLSERTPFMHTVTLPSNSALPSSLKDECNCFYIKPELHEVGMIEKCTTFGNMVRCYNLERTICDFLRCRKRCDEEMVISAIKNYVKYDRKDLNLLSVYAKQFKVIKELKRYLEVLL